MKICKKCTKEKEIDDFYRKHDTPDGRARVCKLCDNERNKVRQKSEKYKTNRLTYYRKYVESNKEKLKLYFHQYFKDHREEYRARERKWRKNNPERSKELGRKNFQKPSRKKKHKANQAMRRAIKLKAIIPGFDEEVKLIYQNCPIGYEVDHIVPLRGKNVCGLHVPWNLQYLTVEENRKKGNR